VKKLRILALVHGHLVPPEAFMLEPWWHNFLWNVATVQPGAEVRQGAVVMQGRGEVSAKAVRELRADTADIQASTRTLAQPGERPSSATNSRTTIVT